VTLQGTVGCVFDGATTAGHYVTISASVAGDCTDGGATFPTGTQVMGRVLSTNGGAGTYNVALFGAEFQSQAGSTTVNGQTCALGGSCTITAAASNIGFGTFAGLPGSPVTNQLYFFTDSIYANAMYNGSAWSYLLDGISMALPPAFTWQNQSTATVTTTSGGDHLISAIGAASNNVNGRYVAYPGGSFTATLGTRVFWSAIAGGSTASNNDTVGLYISDGTKVVLFAVCMQSGALQWRILYGPTVTNITTNVAGPAGTQFLPIVNQFWLRMDDGVTLAANRTYYLSGDGIKWEKVYQEGNTTNVTGTQIGHFANPVDTGAYINSWVFYWLIQ
jgi:hypothetical protein